MIKKILLASSILALTSTVVFADAAPYVGASVGVINNTLNLKYGHSNYTAGSYRGVPVGVFAGYGGVVNQNLYLAGELTGNIVTANLSDNTELKTTYSYGASIIPGIMVSDHSLLYARAGIVRTHFSGKGSENRNGGQVGVGLQTSVTQNVDLRGEYTYTAYKADKVYDGYGNKASFSPRSDQFSLGLIYKFD